MFVNVFKDLKKVFVFDKSYKGHIYGERYTGKIKNFSQSYRWRNEAEFIVDSDLRLNFSLGLDVGCNAGYGTEYLSSIFNSKIIGIDTYKHAIKEANSKFYDSKNEYVFYDGLEIPFSNDTFDFITCFHVIGHVDSISDFVAELYRVLRPGGRLFIVTPNATYKIFAIIDSLINNYNPDLSIRKYWFSFELEKYISNCGFIDINSQYFGDLPMLLKFAKFNKFGRERLILKANK